MGMAMVLITTSDEDRAQLPSGLRHPWAVRSAVVAAIGELVVDKSPKAKSRLRPGALAARVVLGGMAAATLAKVERRAVVPAAIVAALSAVVAAKVGHDLRAAVTRKLPDPLAALVEDAVSVGLAAVAVGALGRRPSLPG
jgi:uncharacterized membrane protein